MILFAGFIKEFEKNLEWRHDFMIIQDKLIEGMNREILIIVKSGDNKARKLFKAGLMKSPERN